MQNSTNSFYVLHIHQFLAKQVRTNQYTGYNIAQHNRLLQQLKQQTYHACRNH